MEYLPSSIDKPTYKSRDALSKKNKQKEKSGHFMTHLLFLFLAYV